MPPLDVHLETALPSRIPVGRGTAIFLRGRCSHASGPISELRVRGGRSEVSAMAWGMPGSDGHADRDEWWAIVPIEGVTEPTTASFGVSATLRDGSESVKELGEVRLEPSGHPGSGATGALTGAEPLIAICMATYEPPLELFERQIASIRGQTYDNWLCVLSDDASRPETLAGMRRILGDDPRFSLSTSGERLGFYLNFERALTLAPAEAPYITLCDQDDRWYPEKLATLRPSLEPDARLVYSDMRIVSERGEVLSDTYWRYRRNNHTDFVSLLVANTVTGAASLFSREILDYALPFPPRLGDAYHDHWIAVVAMALGPISYVDRPLYDYVQHGGAVLGHQGANADRDRSRGRVIDFGLRLSRLARRLRQPEARRRYFDRWCRIALAAQVLEIRCAGELDASRRDGLRLLLSSESSVRGAGWLALRSLRPYFGANETLGMERGLLVGILWRRLAGPLARLRAALRR